MASGEAKAKKQRKYVSVDLESSGPTPGKYSMLSIGACIVGETEKQFYREIKPITKMYLHGAMKIGSLGLRCLDDLRHIPAYDPTHEKFNPKKVLKVLEKEGEDPRDVMQEFADWIKQASDGKGPREIASPIKFDGMFTAWYFDNFNDGRNPLSFSGEDINSMYRGAIGDLDAHISHLGIRDLAKGMPHNALEDAIIQAKEMEAVLEIMDRTCYHRHDD